MGGVPAVHRRRVGRRHRRRHLGPDRPLDRGDHHHGPVRTRDDATAAIDAAATGVPRVVHGHRLRAGRRAPKGGGPGPRAPRRPGRGHLPGERQADPAGQGRVGGGGRPARAGTARRPSAATAAPSPAGCPASGCWSCTSRWAWWGRITAWNFLLPNTTLAAPVAVVLWAGWPRWWAAPRKLTLLTGDGDRRASWCSWWVCPRVCLNLVNGEPEAMGQEMLDDLLALGKISFTGSVRVGKILMDWAIRPESPG